MPQLLSGSGSSAPQLARPAAFVNLPCTLGKTFWKKVCAQCNARNCGTFEHKVHHGKRSCQARAGRTAKRQLGGVVRKLKLRKKRSSRQKSVGSKSKSTNSLCRSKTTASSSKRRRRRQQIDIFPKITPTRQKLVTPKYVTQFSLNFFCKPELLVTYDNSFD